MVKEMKLCGLVLIPFKVLLSRPFLWPILPEQKVDRSPRSVPVAPHRACASGACLNVLRDSCEHSNLHGGEVTSFSTADVLG